jgi:hypothetical protein
VPTNNGSTITGISDVPLPYLFISTPSVHILAGVLALLSIFSLLVAYQLHHKHKHDGFAQKVAAITGSPFTLAGAMSMSTGKLWANETTTPSETVGSLSGTPAGSIDEEKTIISMATEMQEMMKHLTQYTYTLDWSGKVLRNP